MREKILLDEAWQFHKGDANMDFPKTKGVLKVYASAEDLGGTRIEIKLN